MVVSALGRFLYRLPSGSYEVKRTVGGKDFYRTVADKDEEKKLAEAMKLELRRALRKFDKRIEAVLEKFNAKAR